MADKNDEKMTDESVVEQIYGMLEGIEEIKDMRTFEQAMMLSGNKGLVIKYDDGTEFQVTVVQSA